MQYNKEKNEVESTQIEILKAKARRIRHRKDLAIKALSEAISLKGKTEDYGDALVCEILDVADCYVERGNMNRPRKKVL